jgi:hypothetical protein
LTCPNSFNLSEIHLNVEIKRFLNEKTPWLWYNVSSEPTKTNRRDSNAST